MSHDLQQQNNSLNTTQLQNEVTVIDIWLLMMRRKKMIGVITAIIVAVGILYIENIERIYRSEAYVLPPLPEKVQGFNNTGANIKNLSSDILFKKFLDSFKSFAVQKKYFEDNNLYQQITGKDQLKATKEEIDKVFVAHIKGRFDIEQIKGEKHVVLSFETTDGDKAAEWLNGMLESTRNFVIDQNIRNINKNIELEIEKLQKSIKGKRNTALMIRKDAIKKLKEQYTIAKSLNIVDNYVLKRWDNSANTGVSVNTASSPTYLRGTKALKAEINVLESRENDDPFIKGLRGIEEEIEKLQLINIKKSSVDVMSIDRRVSSSNSPIKPKYKLLVLLSVILGLFFGIISAFVTEFILRAKLEVITEKHNK